MADNDGHKDQAADAVAPGGRSSRGPNPDPGGETEAGGLVPPYDDRTTSSGETESQDERAASVARQMEGTPDAGENSELILDDDLVDESLASTPGVRRGEDVADKDNERGRGDKGTHSPESSGDDRPEGDVQRPVGTSDARDSTGIDP